MSEIPQWFWDAVNIKPNTGMVAVEGADIHYFQWGESGKPGLLFIHGHNAHSHWWDFIAPAFMNDYQTVALDLSGMGDSDHRDEYSTDTYASEITAVANQLAMPHDTIIVAHSFGGLMALRAASREPDRFKGLVLLDSGVKHPEDQKQPDVQRWSNPKIYPDFDTAKSRFRLQPPQPCENTYLVEYIARHSIERDEHGWVWKFDEELGMRMTHTGSTEEDFIALDCRAALIYGELSESFSSKSADYMKELNPELEIFPLADARHHLFLDQPLRFIGTLESLLQRW